MAYRKTDQERRLARGYAAERYKDPALRRGTLDAQKRRYLGLPKEKRRDRHLRARFGISIEEYESLLRAQGYRCAICGRLEGEAPGRWGTLAVDHDHETGDIRGLLCFNCNSGLGRFGDNPDILERATSYVRRTR